MQKLADLYGTEKRKLTDSTSGYGDMDLFGF